MTAPAPAVSLITDLWTALVRLAIRRYRARIHELEADIVAETAAVQQLRKEAS